MAEHVVFYQLTRKFVPTERDIPVGPRQVMYYALALGHHVGVMDCLQHWLEVPLADYQTGLAQMPAGVGRRKLEGVLTWGEIEINHSHASDLLPALKQTSACWAGALAQCLQTMLAEPALYVMVRRRA